MVAARSRASACGTPESTGRLLSAGRGCIADRSVIARNRPSMHGLRHRPGRRHAGRTSRCQQRSPRWSRRRPRGIRGADCGGVSPRAELETSSTTISWPISTPKLNENSDQPSASRGKPNSRSTFAKPNPCTSPNTSATHARRSRPSPRTRLSAPTNTMLSAIAGSMMLGGGVTMSSAASDKVMLCPIVKAVTMRTRAPQLPPSSSSPMRKRM